MAYNLIGEGNKVKIQIDGVDGESYPSKANVVISYNQASNTINLGFVTNNNNYYYPNIPNASVIINSVSIVNQSTFDTQIAALFLEAAAASGGGGVVSGSVALNDGVATGIKATVAQFHNIDNQNIGTGNGLLTGGVAQLLNQSGNLDRQRETGIDSVSALGISTGAAQNAQPFSSIHAGATVAGATVTFTPAAMAGFTSGAPWSIQVGSVLVLEPSPVGGPVPANQEAVVVLSVTTTTFTAKAAKSHAVNFNILGFVYNQSRDATAADGSSGQGYGAAGTYLYNQTLNSSNGGWERERSAAGELDGATGVGTAVAAEYEWNGGAPGGGNYDRARNLQAKLKNTGLVNGGSGVAAGVSSITVSSVLGLAAGEQLIIDRGTANQEVVYVISTYVAGSLTIGFVSNTVFTHANGATVEWDDFAANGPGLNGFLATGIGIEEECVYDPVTNLNYVERSASQDAMPVQNIVAETPALFNGATMDRQRNNNDLSLVTLAASAVGGNSADQINYNGRGLQLVIDVTAISGTTPVFTVTVQGKDVASGKYYTLLVSAALSTVSTNLLTVYPGAASTANVSTPQVLPRTFRILYTVSGTTPAVTATIGASVIV